MEGTQLAAGFETEIGREAIDKLPVGLPRRADSASVCDAGLPVSASRAIATPRQALRSRSRSKPSQRVQASLVPSSKPASSSPA